MNDSGTAAKRAKVSNVVKERSATPLLCSGYVDKRSEVLPMNRYIELADIALGPIQSSGELYSAMPPVEIAVSELPDTEKGPDSVRTRRQKVPSAPKPKAKAMAANAPKVPAQAKLMRPKLPALAAPKPPRRLAPPKPPALHVPKRPKVSYPKPLLRKPSI